MKVELKHCWIKRREQRKAILTYYLLPTLFNIRVYCEKRNRNEICCTFSKCSVIIFQFVISFTSSAQIALLHLVKNIFMIFANGRLLESASLIQCNSFQTACPFLLLHVPLYTMYMLLFTGITSSSLIDDMIGTLMSLFPFISPLLTLIFTDDYRKFVLMKLFVKIGSQKETTMTVLKSNYVGKVRPQPHNSVKRISDSQL
uniref:G_PROTEIN_RECEP_F1_2 domain-containing protein n=1 Tax=Angiostrongylus cantonensis TaxID=6313 RepID=A0A0K0CUT6_ANGCA